MIIIFIQRGIFPFGEESFLRTDMYHQYAPFFSEFQHKLRTGGSLLYSWDVGMGVNFAALYAYYLASPLNWLVILLCPKKLIIEFMTDHDRCEDRTFGTQLCLVSEKAQP